MQNFTRGWRVGGKIFGVGAVERLAPIHHPLWMHPDLTEPPDAEGAEPHCA